MAKGLCSGHWQQRAKGKPLTPLLSRGGGLSPSEVDDILRGDGKSPADCWVWTGRTNQRGYGRIRMGEREVLTHRRAWELAMGAIPEGGIIDHLCHNPACFNPSHLRVADHVRNMQNRKGSSSHSRSGIRGVSWDSEQKRWRAQVSANKRLYRKRFDNLADAEEWVSALRKSLHKGVWPG